MAMTHTGTADAAAKAPAAAGETPESLNDHGLALAARGRPDLAVAAYDRALALRPGYPPALNNKGAALRALGRPAQALACYEQAALARHDFAEARWNAANLRLLLGDFATGWEGYEWRRRLPRFQSPSLPAPEWVGHDAPGGRTILLHAEQGYGDTIQFLRFVPVLAARGARVHLWMPPALHGLCGRLEGVAKVSASLDALAGFDCHAPLMSLPRLLETRLDTLPAPASYLRADPARVTAWRERLDARATGRPRIGLAWSGRPTHTGDRQRSLPLAALAPLLALPVEFVGLQKDVRDEDRATLDALAARHPSLAHEAPGIESFDDTAALVACCDRVVSVDTATAHLAGALGAPVDILIPFAPDWRWLTARSDSPWYPGARLHRQTRPDDWTDVIEGLAATLAAGNKDAR